MDDFGLNRAKVSIRAEALNRLAKSGIARHHDGEEENEYSSRKNNLSKLTSVLENPKDSSGIAMSGKEFEVLLSLARAAEHVVVEEDAYKLIHQLGRYLLESPAQKLVNAPSVKRTACLSPWEKSTDLLTRAVLQLMSKFESLAEDGNSYLLGYLESLQGLWNSSDDITQDFQRFFPFLFSLQGFLNALTASRWLLSQFPYMTLNLMKNLNNIINGNFLLKVEGAVSGHMSSSENSYSDPYHSNSGLWLWAFNRYQESGFQIGAMLLSCYLCKFFRSIAETFVKERPEFLNAITDDRWDGSLIDNLLDVAIPGKLSSPREEILQISKDLAVNQIESLDEGADYIELASPEKIQLAFSIKAAVLEIIAVVIYYDIFDMNVATKYVESSLTHQHAMTDKNLALAVFKLGAFICYKDEAMGPTLTRYLPHFVANSEVTSDLVWESTRALVQGFRVLSQDVIVSMVYTLINSLVPENEALNSPPGGHKEHVRSHPTSGQLSFASAQDLPAINGKPKSHAYKNIVTAIVSIAAHYEDTEITILAATVLTQKLNSVSRKVDREVLLGLSNLAVYLSEREFRLILKNYAALEANSLKVGEEEVLDTIQYARSNIARALSTDQHLYDVYLKDLLLSIVGKGDVQELEHHRPHTEISATAEEIARLIPPLADLLPRSPEKPYETTEKSIISLFRNAWFNMVVHGFAKNSELTAKLRNHLENIARSTPPLVSEISSNKIESELELNTVLRRGSSNHNVSNQKAIMSNIFSLHNFEFRAVPYPKLMFLSAAVLLESLRANTGNCSKVLLYFGDPGFKSGDTSRYMANIATDSTKAYIKNVIRGGQEEFTIDRVAEQLKEILVLCCHRVSAIQNIAFTCAELLIKSIPGSLCRSTSLFTLLDLLTLIWTSCLDAETDEYEPRAVFTSAETNIKLELSDSYEHRRDTLKRLLDRSRAWAQLVLSVMSFDLKSLLTTYLAAKGEYRPINDVALGSSFAMEIGAMITKADGSLATIAHSDALSTDSTSGFLSQYIWRTEFKGDKRIRNHEVSLDELQGIKRELEQMIRDHTRGSRMASFGEIRNLLFKASALLSDERQKRSIARIVVKIPFRIFTEKSIQLGISLWLWAINELPQLKPAILAQVAQEWEYTVWWNMGLFSQEHDLPPPEFTKMEYSPSSKTEINHHMANSTKSFSVHLNLIRFLSSVFQASTYESKHILRIFTRLLGVSLDNMMQASRSPLARSVRFELIKFAIDVYHAHARFSAKICDSMKDQIFTAALTGFDTAPHWPFGGNKLKLRSDVSLLKVIAQSVVELEVPSTKYNEIHKVSAKRDLLLLFLNDELSKMVSWLDALQIGPAYKDTFGKKHLANYHIATAENVRDAWQIDPVLATCLVERYKSHETVATLQTLISKEPIKVINVPVALQYFLSGSGSVPGVRRNLLYWTPVSPIDSINLFLPEKGGDSILLQYAMRSLESHDVNITFFYVPQIVQMLRYDKAGYIARYILETAKLSQLFSHQIIWNMLANSYMDEDAQEPDVLKPTLDEIIEKMKNSFNDEERNFYSREFNFFNEVTSISGKLKPYIKKSKAEKKIKIDEEIDNIKVDVGVYLPSNPDGTVVDIDRKSGKPLQSHAKAPFMATFKIEREVPAIPSSDDTDEYGSQATIEKHAHQKETHVVDVWQSAIFKVGDDCRQDMLALQIIAVFRSIFKHSGLDLYVYPYRVTATGTGCGVIDVLPNSISRDMLGREAVNGLYEYFTTKHGGEDSIEFQRARNNFVKSLAAYSVISYLIQFKDRHNGNIMYDSQGHVLHIDFGFCFDIVPGGVKFEAAPFKLTHEMVAVMGGGPDTQAYKWFEELCVKAYLSCRPYCETIVQMVRPMLDSGLPCFKGDLTIKRLRNRFVLDKSEREAAQFFRGLVRKSYESMYTKGYDEFQRITNGIPY